jgi:shikimate 5-dehydrogenase
MAGLTASRNVDGILVTMPHKFTVFAHCATSSERAKMLGVAASSAAILTGPGTATCSTDSPS